MATEEGDWLDELAEADTAADVIAEEFLRVFPDLLLEELLVWVWDPLHVTPVLVQM